MGYNKDPAVLFYTDDFLAGTILMNYTQRGKYITLLCLQHQQGHLSEEDMLSICGEYDKKIFDKFTKDENGLYFNERMEIETLKRANFVKARQENGAKGGRPKKPTENLKKTDRLSLAKPTENLLGNGNINGNIIDNEDNIELVIPTFEQVKEYAIKRDRLDLAKVFYDYYTEGNWKDKDGKQVKGWKQKFITWEHRNPKEPEKLSSFDVDDFWEHAVKRSQEIMRGNKK